MPHPRQFTMMSAGDIVANYQRRGEWRVIPVAEFSGAGCCYYTVNTLDLRALLAGKESGVEISAIIPQEAGPWTPVVAEFNGWFYTVDILTTVEPTEQSISNIFKQPDMSCDVPGFLSCLDTPDLPPTSQDLNPSQVVWGWWRYWATDRNATAGTNALAKGAQQGYFGEGETIVAPALFWTRIVVTMADTDSITIPSSNLVVRGMAVDLTMPQEITQMMRAAQR